MSFVLAIDQGTTSSRAIVFRADISVAGLAQQEFPQHFPASGWVEHEPEDIWSSTIATCRDALKQARLTAKDIAAIG
ncbi:MAG: glycerol kinase, partial [Bradyrhizobium sp.]|nr:glycerol kinase [Bradyrhizobium sp.]